MKGKCLVLNLHLFFFGSIRISKHVYHSREKEMRDGRSQIPKWLGFHAGNHGSACYAAGINSLCQTLMSRREEWEPPCHFPTCLLLMRWGWVGILWLSKIWSKRRLHQHSSAVIILTYKWMPVNPWSVFTFVERKYHRFINILIFVPCLFLS